ncbi:replication initiation protein [Halomonas sp. TBZ9]|uniref:Replication initiation protein n=1 Tax=Vreelandella azerica TaxID=2732867 RepID=A0A7Y3XC13_9GAMM|nr:replication initiation protein [Halomonas azerica]NOG32909.1 replication initiation protein [Halomonas azerica]
MGRIDTAKWDGLIPFRTYNESMSQLCFNSSVRHRSCYEPEKNSLRVYKANAVIEACYDLSVAEHRLLLACFAQIGKEATDERLYRVYARDIAALADIPTQDAYRDAAIAVERLYERSVEVFEGPNGTAPPKNVSFAGFKKQFIRRVRAMLMYVSAHRSCLS